MGHIEDLKLPADVLDVILELTEKGSFDGRKLSTLYSTVVYFDTLTGKIKAKYDKDIKSDSLSKKQVWIESFNFLTDHGRGADDYRKSYVVEALEYVTTLSHDYALIRIGSIVNDYAQCEAHSQFYKQTESNAKFNEIIEALRDLPKYISDREQLIKDLSTTYPEPRETWKTRVYRYDQKKGKYKKVQKP